MGEMKKSGASGILFLLYIHKAFEISIRLSYWGYVPSILHNYISTFQLWFMPVFRRLQLYGRRGNNCQANNK